MALRRRNSAGMSRPTAGGRAARWKPHSCRKEEKETSLPSDTQLYGFVQLSKSEPLKEADLEDNIFKAEDLSEVEDPTTSGGEADADLKEGQILAGADLEEGQTLAKANLEEVLTFIPTVEEEDEADGTTTMQEEAKHKLPEIKILTLLNVSDVAPKATHKNYAAFLHI
jgi:hypothetical protein